LIGGESILIERIKDRDEEIAIIIYKDSFEEGVNFVTSKTYSLQFGLLKYQKGDSANPHTHPNVPRVINQSQEVIHVEKGKIELDIFNSEGKLVTSRILEKGDSAFFVSGGRGWTALEESEIFEVKQGPFREEIDKILL
jgi:oxalate decarboxylase/phosphoglucose isomerase-like protein (cupin superfamily)